MKTKLFLFLPIVFLSTIVSNAQTSYSSLVEATVVENPDGTATLTATIVGDLSEYSGDNYITVSDSKYSTDMISVVTEVSTASGIGVMVVKVNYPIDSEKDATMNSSKIEVYLGVNNSQGIFKRTNPIYSDAAAEQVNALFEEMDLEEIIGGDY